MDEQHEWNLRLERQHLREKKHSAGAMDECPLTAGPVKIEEGAPRSRLRRGRWAEPSRSSSSSSSSSSSQHVTTEAYRDHCGGLQAESLLAPPSSDGDGTTLESKDGNQEHLPPERQDDHSGACPVLSSTSAGTGRNPPVTLMRMSDIENGGTGEQRDWNSGLGREQEQHVKEEENAAVIAALKTNDDNGPRSRLHPSQSGEKRWAEPPSGGMKSEDGGGQRGGSRAGGLFPPVSLDTVDGRAQGDATSRGRDARWKCSRCGETFGAKKNLRRHAVLHAREQPLGFSRCQRLPPKANLITWARAQPPSSCSHHSASTNGKKTHAGGEKPFQCSVCSQTFSQKQNLKTHMRIHTGERPFACSTCGARFTQKISLTHHLRTHTGEKPFSCSECNKGFAHPSAHLRHMKLHTRVKPFVCPNCDQRFTRKNDVNGHKCVGVVDNVGTRWRMHEIRLDGKR
ncbi:zinc finger protein GLI4-like isoform X2 [Syngnathoides biaculeatus]|uniref:zinc finger protein GLI4-like isoform X2 n=1 Tax=Syngnathoides biaculeatus TaxID=300417 RepID=UPI002ADE33E2|nr:zinc finger protein GLI4-like isoform X2 [Syngnathoides biaculeatus]